MAAFKTLDDRRRQGQARAGPRRPQRADGRRQGHRRHPHRARRADHPRTLRQGRQGHPARAFRPPEGRAGPGVLAGARSRAPLPTSSAGRSPSPRTASAQMAAEARRRHAPTATSCCWKTPASTRARRRTIRPSPRAAANNGDIFVNDAFSAAHRAHSSTEGLARICPAFAGRTMQAELEALEKGLGNPARPVVAIVGGAKVSTKIDLLMNLVKKVDALVIGGGMANTFLAARGDDVGKSLCEHDLADDRQADHDRGGDRRLRDRAAGRRRRRQASSRPAPPARRSTSTPCPPTP